MSPHTDDKDPVRALASIIRDQLTRGEEIFLPGLGIFSVEHESSQTVEPEDGQILMLPPRDVIVFRPED
jgi:nucleoid DNA-binding protein